MATSTSTIPLVVTIAKQHAVVNAKVTSSGSGELSINYGSIEKVYRFSLLNEDDEIMTLGADDVRQIVEKVTSVALRQIQYQCIVEADITLNNINIEDLTEEIQNLQPNQQNQEVDITGYINYQEFTNTGKLNKEIKKADLASLKTSCSLDELRVERESKVESTSPLPGSTKITPISPNPVALQSSSPSIEQNDDEDEYSNSYYSHSESEGENLLSTQINGDSQKEVGTDSQEEKIEDPVFPIDLGEETNEVDSGTPFSFSSPEIPKILEIDSSSTIHSLLDTSKSNAAQAPENIQHNNPEIDENDQGNETVGIDIDANASSPILELTEPNKQDLSLQVPQTQPLTLEKETNEVNLDAPSPLPEINNGPTVQLEEVPSVQLEPPETQSDLILEDKKNTEVEINETVSPSPEPLVPNKQNLSLQVQVPTITLPEPPAAQSVLTINSPTQTPDQSSNSEHKTIALKTAKTAVRLRLVSIEPDIIHQAPLKHSESVPVVDVKLPADLENVPSFRELIENSKLLSDDELQVIFNINKQITPKERAKLLSNLVICRILNKVEDVSTGNLKNKNADMEKEKTELEKKEATFQAKKRDLEIELNDINYTKIPSLKEQITTQEKRINDEKIYLKFCDEISNKNKKFNSEKEQKTLYNLKDIKGSFVREIFDIGNQELKKNQMEKEKTELEKEKATFQAKKRDLEIELNDINYTEIPNLKEQITTKEKRISEGKSYLKFCDEISNKSKKFNSEKEQETLSELKNLKSSFVREIFDIKGQELKKNQDDFENETLKNIFQDRGFYRKTKELFPEAERGDKMLDRWTELSKGIDNSSLQRDNERFFIFQVEAREFLNEYLGALQEVFENKPYLLKDEESNIKERPHLNKIVGEYKEVIKDPKTTEERWNRYRFVGGIVNRNEGKPYFKTIVTGKK